MIPEVFNSVYLKQRMSPSYYADATKVRHQHGSCLEPLEAELHLHRILPGNKEQNLKAALCSESAERDPELPEITVPLRASGL